VHKETLDVDGDGENETSDMTTVYYYDGLDRVEKQVGPDEIEGVFEYEAFGNMVCRMDDPDTETYEGLNRVTEYDFDRLGRQIAISILTMWMSPSALLKI